MFLWTKSLDTPLALLILKCSLSIYCYTWPLILSVNEVIVGTSWDFFTSYSQEVYGTDSNGV